MRSPKSAAVLWAFLVGGAVLARVATPAEGEGGLVVTAPVSRPELVLPGAKRPKVDAVAFSPDGRQLASCLGNTVVVWDPGTGRAERAERTGEGSVTSVAFSPDGRSLTATVGDQARQVRSVLLWGVAGAAPATVFRRSRSATAWVGFTPDGRLVEVEADGRADTLRAAGNANSLGVPSASEGVPAPAFSPDGKLLAWPRGCDILLCDARTGRRERVLRGHNGGLTSLAFSPDGKRLVSTGRDRALVLWNVASGVPEGTLPGLAEPATCLAFSPDGRKLACGGDLQVVIWDTAVHKTVATIRAFAGRVRSLAFSPDGAGLVMMTENGVASWDAVGWQAAEEVLRGGQTIVTAFSRDGRKLAYAMEWSAVRFASQAATDPGKVSPRSTLVIQDTAAGKVDKVLLGPAVSSLALGPDGRSVAAGSREGTIVVWDAGSGQVWRTLSGHSERVDDLVFTSDGRKLASLSKNKAIFWDLASGSVDASMERARGMNDLALSPDARRVVCPTPSGAAHIWDAATGRSTKIMGDGVYSGASVGFSPDGSKLAWRDGKYGGLCVWEMGAGMPAAKLAGTENERGSLVTFSADGRCVLAAAADGTATVWDAATGRLVKTLSRMEKAQRRGDRGADRDDYVESVAVSPDGTKLAAGWQHGTVGLWDIPTGRVVQARKFEHGLPKVSFSSDGQRLVVNCQRHFAFWNLATGRDDEVLGRPFRAPRAVAFSQDGSVLACAMADGALVTKDAASSALEVIPAAVSGEATVLAFSPDKRRLAVGGRTGAVHVRSIGAGTVEKTFKEHESQVLSLAFSPDGSRLASGSAAKVVLWDLHTGRAEKVLSKADAGVTSVVTTPDRRRLVSGSWGAPGGLWSSDTGPPGTAEGGEVIGAPVAFDREGKMLATGSPDGSITLWDAASGQPIGRVPGDAAPVTCLDLSPDGRLLASGDEEGAVTLRASADAGTGGLPAATIRLFSLAEGSDWLAMGPGGYYACSPGAERLITWRVGTETFPFDTFSQRFHRPDLLRKALAGEELPQEAAPPGALRPPSVAFTSPAYGTEVASNKVEVALRARSDGAPIQRIEVAVNGMPLPAEAAKALVADPPAEKERTFRISVPLPAGEWRARVRAVAYDTQMLRSKPAELLIIAPGAKRLPSTLYVLCVGVNEYRDPALTPLRYAAPDATALAAILRQQEGPGKPYQKVSVQVLVDRETTLSRLKFALRALKDAATEGDVAIVFIAGHGGLDEQGNYVFGNTDVDIHDLANTALSWQDFVSALREVRAKRVLVLADTCHSGGIVGAQARANEVLADRLNKEAHRVVFVASAAGEVSKGLAEFGHGVFTQALLEAFTGAADAAPRDGEISFRELADYVRARTEVLGGGEQHPQMPFLDNYDPDAVLAHWIIPAERRETPRDPAPTFLCRMAAQTEKGTSGGWNNVGAAHYRLGKYSEAVEAYRSAIALDPASALPYVNMAAALYRLGKLPEALAACRKGADLDPRSAAAWAQLGAACAALDKPDEAKDALRKAVALDPEDADARHGQGEFLLSAGDAAAAVSELRRAVELSPEDAGAWSALGAALDELGQGEEALRAYTEAARLAPDDAFMHCRRGILLDKRGMPAEAVAAYRAALRLDPACLDACYNLAWLLKKQGDGAGAITAMRSFLQAARHRPEEQEWAARAEQFLRDASSQPAKPRPAGK